MTSIEFHNAQRSLRARNSNRIAGAIARMAMHVITAIGARHQRRRDRAAFMNLTGKEEWLYEDMGISRADVEWAARLPLHVNAARELDKLRARNVNGR